MEENNQEKQENKTPSKMARLAWPKSKYGVIIAIIMFFVLGFIPGWIIAKVLHGMGKLRIPKEVELAGLDYTILEDASNDEKAVASSTR